MPDAIAIRLAKRYVKAVDAAWDAACELDAHLWPGMYTDETCRRARGLLYHTQMRLHLEGLAHSDYCYETSARRVLDILTGNEREPEEEHDGD